MKEAKRGDRVSLNTEKRQFYFQDGEFGIQLISGQNEVAIIHEKATDQQLSQINHAIQLEHLVMGWPGKAAVSSAEKDSEIKTILEGGRNKINEWMFSVRDDKKIKHESKVSQIEKIIFFEKAGKNRKSILDTAESILSYMGGVSSVEETETEKVEIKLTSGNKEEAETK